MLNLTEENWGDMAAFKHVWGRRWFQVKCLFQHRNKLALVNRNKLELVNSEVMDSDGVLSVGYFLCPGPVCFGVIKEMTLIPHYSLIFIASVEQ